MWLVLVLVMQLSSNVVSVSVLVMQLSSNVVLVMFLREVWRSRSGDVVLVMVIW